MARTAVIAAAGVALGAAASFFYFGQPETAQARTDRYGDYVMATGAVNANPRVPTDGVWLLDYRAGQLLGSVIDRNSGKVRGWARVDLVRQFGIPPRQDVHFMMSTGLLSRNQAALYVAEVNTGRFGVFTMAPAGNGVIIRQHDLSQFRANVPAKPAGPPAPPPPAGGVPAAPVMPVVPEGPPK